MYGIRDSLLIDVEQTSQNTFNVTFLLEPIVRALEMSGKSDSYAGLEMDSMNLNVLL